MTRVSRIRIKHQGAVLENVVLYKGISSQGRAQF